MVCKELWDKDYYCFENLNLRKFTGRRAELGDLFVNFWPPMKKDIELFTYLARCVNDGNSNPKVLDIGAGSAFLSYLLAREGNIDVIALDPKKDHLNNSCYSHDNLLKIPRTGEYAAKMFKNAGIDVVINSWMPNGTDLTKYILEMNPKMIIYVRGKAGYCGDGIRSFDTYGRYHQIASWRGISIFELDYYFREIKDIIYGRTMSAESDFYDDPSVWRAYLKTELRNCTPYSHADENIFEVQLRNDVLHPKLPLVLEKITKYPWEDDMDYLMENTKRQALPKELVPVITKDN